MNYSTADITHRSISQTIGGRTRRLGTYYSSKDINDQLLRSFHSPHPIHPPSHPSQLLFPLMKRSWKTFHLRLFHPMVRLLFQKPMVPAPLMRFSSHLYRSPFHPNYLYRPPHTLSLLPRPRPRPSLLLQSMRRLLVSVLSLRFDDVVVK